MDPRSSAADALYATARWLLDGERLEDALYVFRAMLLAAPDDERGWLGLGLCHESLGQHSVAREILQTANVALSSARCRIALARLLRTAGLLDEADRELEAADAIATDSGDVTLVGLVSAERSAA